MKLKYAIIGCGRISNTHIGAAMNNSELMEISAVCDIEPQKARDELEKAGLSDKNIPVFSDYREMLKEIKPDMCSVATFSGLHPQIAADCIKAGANVLVEKPLALSVKDARELITLAEKEKKVLGVCFQNRFNKAVTEIRSAIDSGRFGRLLYGTAQIRWGRSRDYYSQADWRGTWKLDGGALMNQCIHDIDLLLWMMGGEPTEVFAYTDRLNHAYIEAEDLGLALIRFKNGTYGMIEGTTDVYPKNLEETLCVFGERGTVKAAGKAVNTIESWVFGDGLDTEQQVKKACLENTASVYGFGHTPLYRNFCSAVINGTPLMASASDGLLATEVILAIYKSAATGLPVKFPLVDCASTDFTGRFI